MILDSFRRKFIDKVLNNKKEPASSSFTFNKIKTIGCLLNLDEIKHWESFMMISTSLGLPKATVKLLGYTSNIKADDQKSIPMYSKKDVSAFGKVKSSEVQEFLDTDFDLLINFFSKDSFPLLAISGSSKATVRAGFAQVDNRCNDVILNCELENTDMFFKELKTYLQVITK